jgi:hypothetical protein
VKQGDRAFLFNEQGDLIIAKLTPEDGVESHSLRGTQPEKGALGKRSKYEEISRARLLEPDNRDPGRPVVWSHPAFANRCVYARNDHEIVCASLAAE